MARRTADAGRSPLAPSFSVALFAVFALGAAYEAVLLFTGLLGPYRFPIPYAVPIFDAPFSLVALGIAYLCVERHRLRQDAQSLALGMSLGVTGLLALAHIATQPDYPGRPGVDAGIAPNFFFLSYLGAFIGIGLAARLGDRPAPLTDRQRALTVLGVIAVSAVIVIAVLQVRPLLPSLVMKPGRLTPFACWTAGLVNGVAGLWALWGARRRALSRSQDWFAGLLVVAGFVWLVALMGFLIFPYRYGVSWYIAGLARPVGVGMIFLALLREQVWLYREARARLTDLEALHEAGQALVRSLDPQQIVDTIVTRAVVVSGADAAILFKLDTSASTLRGVSRAPIGQADFALGTELRLGEGAAGLAIRRQQPVWSRDLAEDPSISLTEDLRAHVRGGGWHAAIAIPIMVKSGDVFGALSVLYRDTREFVGADLELLSAFGTQVSVALENANSFDELARRARNDAALQGFGQRLLEATTESVIVDDAVVVAGDLLDADFVSLFLLDAKSGMLRLVAGLGWDPGVVGEITVPKSAESFAGYAFLTKEPVRLEDLATEQRFATPAYVAAHGVRAGVVVPLGVHQQPVGVLGVYYRARRPAHDEEARVLTSVAHHAALALEKVRLYVELQANLVRLQETQAQLIQADKLTALGTLLSGMAHELNNPLSTIQLSVQLMKRQELPPAIVKRMNAVEEECARASRIIKDLLMFARRKAPERRSTDLNRVLRGVLALQAPELELSRIRVVSELGPLPPILADSHQLQQVFLNLFTNARHAMKAAHGEGTLTIRSSTSDGEVQVEVEDDGPGIPAEYLGRIFDPFFTTKGAGEGTGLGLSLSIGIVEAHGGRLRVENLPGRGARFTLRLPADDTETSDTQAASPRTVTAGRRGRLLIVDDEPKLREALVDILTSLGHDVASAATGEQALAQLASDRFDVIALDLRLPDVDGKEIWQRTLRERPAVAARVVFMTGDTMSPETQKFLQETGRPVLMKPFSIERLAEIIAEILAAPPPDRA